MAKRCPVDGEMKVYLQCMECDDKVCRHPKSLPDNEGVNKNKDVLHRCKEFNDCSGGAQMCKIKYVVN